MKITRRQLRRIIREAVESQYYKDLKQRGSDRGKIVSSVKDFSKIVIDQVETLVSGIDVSFDPIEKRHSAFTTLKVEIDKFLKELDREYDTKIRNPKLQKEKEKAGSWRSSNLPEIDEDSLSAESEKYYMDHD